MATKTKSRKFTTALTVSRRELLINGSDQAFRQFVHDLLAFSARLQDVRNRLGQVIGLSGIQYTVLIAIAHLRETDEKVGVALVAEHLHFSGAFITIETNKLVAAGLVEKGVDSEDRRRVLLAVTRKARALLDELAPIQRPANDMLFGCLSARDFERVRAIASEAVQSGAKTLRLLDYLTPTRVRRHRDM